MLSERMKLIVRNAMVKKVCREARDYAARFLDTESRDYAGEFACELKKEFDGGFIGI